MRTACAALLCGALSVGLAWTPEARAAGPAEQAAAEVLFTEGRKLAAAGNYEQACPKFVESQRLAPTVGGALSVGDCFEKLGKLASAWGTFKDAEMTARSAGDAARQAEAARRAEALAPRLTKLVIAVPPAVRVPGLEVRRDGGIVGEGQWGSAMPVDQGQHTIEASAPGRTPWSKIVRVDADGASASVDVPELAAGGPGAVAGAPPGSGTQKTVGFVLGGAGVAGLVVGAVLGGLTLKKVGDSKSDGHCDADLATCDATGLQLQRDARTMAHGSTAALVIGGAMLATGIVLVVAAPAGNTAGPSTGGLRLNLGAIAGATMSGVLLSGRW
jgi:hypothetical protein